MSEIDYHYVGAMFEDKFNSTPENPKFYGRKYTYKTTKPLKEGQVIEIESTYGRAKVCIVDENINPEDINFDLDLIKEI